LCWVFAGGWLWTLILLISASCPVVSLPPGFSGAFESSDSMACSCLRH
jgi:hypothetical protein